MIIVHELGHFLAALWCGMRVDKFALWFGKPLWSKRINGVEYILGSIPLGGYVALPQMVNPESLEGKTEVPAEKLPPVSPLSKAIVAFAGPLFSFLLAVVFACIVFVIGKEDSDANVVTTIGYIKPGSAADVDGLHVLDKILKIDGQPVEKWHDVTTDIIFSTAAALPIEVSRDGKDMTVTVHPSIDNSKTHHWSDRGQARIVGIGPKGDVLVDKLDPNGPGIRAGLKPDDQITMVNGQPLYSAGIFEDLLKNHPTDPISLSYIRDGKTFQTVLQPMEPVDRLSMPPDGPRVDMGVQFKPREVLTHVSPISQIADSSIFVVRILVALFTPNSNVHLSDTSTPVGIVPMLATILLQEHGINLVLYISMAINVNLAIFNLLPFPILDGGHITVAIIEMIRRRPTSIAILEPLQMATLAGFSCLFLYVLFFDVQDVTNMLYNGVHKKTFPEIPAKVST
jgi:regulator of sigma E protease